MEMPILTDTEAETSVDMEESVLDLNRISLANSNATRSIFNITMDNVPEEQANVELKSYEARLKQEVKQWSALWRSSIQQLKEFKLKPHPVVDRSLLSADKLEYLNKAPDLQSFLRDSLEFRNIVHVILENDHAELQQAQDNLLQVCEHAAMVAKESKIVQNLANK